MIQFLGELIFRQLCVDIYAKSPGFHRLTLGDISPKSEPLIKIPGLREELWAPTRHARAEQVHDLGLYTGVELTVVGDGYLFYGSQSVYQSDVVVPYIRSLAEAQSPKVLVVEDRPVIVGYDRGFATYGHFLIDFLPRILIAERMLGSNFGEALILLPDKLPDWGLKVFNLLFPEAKTITFDSKQFSLRLSRAILPTHCHKYYMFHPFSREIFKTLASRAGPIAPEKPAKFIFISRNGVSSNRSTVGIEAIEQHAISLGATLLHPETLSWRHQLGYFADAKLVVGEYGSALHNTVFSGDRVRTLSINRLQFLQSFIGALNKQRLTYVLPMPGELNNNVQKAVFDIDEIKRALDFLVKTEFG
jgi:capsular polysaccharide biosynthesis protein